MMQRVRISPLVAGDAADAAQPQATSAAVGIAEKLRLEAEVRHHRLLAVLQGLPTPIKQKHAVGFFTLIESKSRSQQVKVQCMACGHALTSTGSTRLQKHILSCALMPTEVKEPFSKLSQQLESVRMQKREHETLVNEEAKVEAVEHAKKQAKLVQQGVRAGLKTIEVAEADMAIAKFFYANGLSFGAASAATDSYYREMVRKIQLAPTGYIPPNYNKIAGPLLEESYAWMWSKIDERDPKGSRTRRFCTTYVSDGWDSVDNLPLINSAFITANDGGIYWRSVDTSGKEKNAVYCAALMIADIYQYGPLKVILVITDTCTTMRKCWSIVMDEFPWIMVLPCQAHVISLLMKDIGKSNKVRFSRLLHKPSNSNRSLHASLMPPCSIS